MKNSNCLENQGSGWISQGKRFFFLQKNSGQDFSLASTWAIGSLFHRGHYTLNLTDLYSSVHSNSLPHLGPRIYLLSLSGNKKHSPRLPRSKLLIPFHKALASISSWSFLSFFFTVDMCIFVSFFLVFSNFVPILQIHNLN